MGPVKVTASVALTTAALAWSALTFPGDPALQEIANGAEYVANCYSVDGAGRPLNITYLVGDLPRQRSTWERAEDVREWPVFSVRCSDGPSDLAGQVVAAMASSALALLKHGAVSRDAAARTIDVAHDLFVHAMDRPGRYSDIAGVQESGLNDHLPSNSFADDLFWAATWLYRAVTEEGFRRPALMY
jgi:hypothetical protein